MKVLAKCPKCGHVLELHIDSADKRKRCSNCRGIVKIPDLISMDKAVRIIETSDSHVIADTDGNLYA